MFERKVNFMLVFMVMCTAKAFCFSLMRLHFLNMINGLTNSSVNRIYLRQNTLSSKDEYILILHDGI